MHLPKNLTLTQICDAVAEDDNTGFCLRCGEKVYGIEPDAREYPCEGCNTRTVYGSEELLLMFG